MEENSEVHMETDVSSTTGDTFETQQLPGSHGDVEMVIVVEKMTEEDIICSSDYKSGEKDAKDTKDTAPNSITSPQKDSPQKSISPCKERQITNGQSPEKNEPSLNTKKSPLKSEAVICQKMLTKSEDMTNNIQKVLREESIINAHNNPNKSEHAIVKIQKSPTKPEQTEIKIQITPTKPKQVVVITQKTPTKSEQVVSKIQKTPSKSQQSLLSTQISTSKSEEILNSVKTSPNKVIEIEKSLAAVDSSNKEIVTDNKDKISSLQPPILIGGESAQKFTEKELSLDKKTKTVDKTLVDKAQTDNKYDKKDDIVFTTSIDICEKSNDSQLETCSDVSEKEHNKSISRELKSLIKSAKESKIISECTQLTSKTRKSRSGLDTSSTNMNVSLEADKIQALRRSSTNSQKSNCSEKSEKTPKRSMRSQNPEFVHKVKQFLNSVTGKHQKGDSEDEDLDDSKIDSHNDSKSPTPKKKKQNDQVQEPEIPIDKSNKLRSDPYCWRCHWQVEQVVNDRGHPPMHCTVCPRSFHYKCLTGNERNKITPEKSWVCPECLSVLHAESSETRSAAMKKISLGMLCELLQHALERMMDLNGVEPFMQPVDRTAFPDYDKYVVHPMDLSLMKQNIADGLYGSTEAFVGDAQWILHNSIIFNTLQSKLTGGARALVRSCRAEMGEIEACPECYAAAHARRPTWFTDVCSTPHALLWAKLKGFPYWPAKGMTVNGTGMVDVRFFGAHDRAWVPAKDCFLYCEKDPNNFRTKRQDILDSMQEAEQHIRNISRKYGKFVYPPFKTQFDPSKLNEQLKMMIPTFDGEIKSPIKDKQSNASPKDKSRSNSKSSKSSIHDSDVSETEDAQAIKSRKMADGAEIAREEEDISFQNDKPMEVDVPKETSKEKEPSRKRRRSDLEEAVITIIETSTSEKRKRVTSIDREEKKTHSNSSDDKVNKPTNSTGEIKEADKSTSKVDKTPAKTNEKTNNDKSVNENSTPKNTTKEPPNSTNEKEITTLVTPIKVTPKVTSKIKIVRTSTPKEDKAVTPKQKTAKLDKSALNEKEKQEEKTKSQKRRNSRNRSLNNSQINKSLNNSQIAKDKNAEKKNVKDIAVTTNKIANGNKEKNEEKTTKAKENESEKTSERTNRSNKTDSPKPAKDRIQFDDDTSLAVIAREVGKGCITGLPTISSVRSLSTMAQSPDTTTKTNTKPKGVEYTVTASAGSSIFTPTSTDNVRNMKEATNKLQKLRNETEPPMVGRVGVRAFARMTSPEKDQSKTNDMSKNVEIEIKSEPIDFDDADRQSEKMDLMNAFRLQPVNPPKSNSLREVRINKVVVAPVAQKSASKPPEIRVKAKKSFPQPRKVDDGRSELNSKNSMVYIPIQPPSTQAPVKPSRPITINGATNTQTVRPQISNTSIASNNSVVNTITTPMLSTQSTLSNTTTIVSNSINNTICVPTVGQVPTTVHTVPLITSVNGQWTLSLQPMMSVGGVDSTFAPSPPIVNGLPDRPNAILPIAATPTIQQASHLTAIQAAPQVTPIQPVINAQPNIANITTVQNMQAAGSNNSSNESAPGEPPRLQQRPPLLSPLDANTPMGGVPTPSTAGPVTAKLNQNAVKLTDFFRNLLEDSLEKIDDPTTQISILKLQAERMKWKHQQELKEMKHNLDLTMAEMRSSFEKEKTRLLTEVRRTAQAELEAAVKATKTKQWCANCSQEAQFYCCWNTSYCDYSCQRSHWSQHFAVCTQQRNQEKNGNNEAGNTLDKRLQGTPENLPALQKNSTATITMNSKLAPSRLYTHEQNKTSIIVSMIDDPAGGHPTVKCVGTYKPGGQQVSPLIINKQIMNNEENASKKVVTSGGYLIVGASTAPAPLVTPPRRPHTIQYFS